MDYYNAALQILQSLISIIITVIFAITFLLHLPLALLMDYPLSLELTLIALIRRFYNLKCFRIPSMELLTGYPLSLALILVALIRKFYVFL